MLHPISPTTPANPDVGSSCLSPSLSLLLSQLSIQNPFRCRRALQALAGIPNSLTETAVLDKLLNLIVHSHDDLLVRQGLALLHQLSPTQIPAPAWNRVTATLQGHLPRMSNTLNACLTLMLLSASPHPLHAWSSQRIPSTNATWRVICCTTQHDYVVYGHLWSGMTGNDYLDTVLNLGHEQVTIPIHRQGSLHTWPRSLPLPVTVGPAVALEQTY